MPETLFISSMRFLHHLNDNAALSPEKVLRLAVLALELEEPVCGGGPDVRPEPDETRDIVNMVLEREAQYRSGGKGG